MSLSSKIKEGAIDYLDDEVEIGNDDYPITKLAPGEYLFLITNDIRYLETTYAISLNVNVLLRSFHLSITGYQSRSAHSGSWNSG